MADLDDQAPPQRSSEGVRILGAEEAQTAVGAGPRPAPAPRRPDPTAAPRPVTRFPLPSDRPTPSAPADPGGPIPLPHWTEPPTGDVPRVEGDAGGSAFEEWAAGGVEPRFRADAGAWAGSDFGDDPLHDDTTAMGALVDVPDVDEGEEFAAQVAARRAPPRRAPAEAPRPTRPPGVYASEARGSGPRRPTSPADDMPTRVVTALVLAAVGLLAFVVGRAATAVLVTVIIAAAALELFEGLRRAGFQPATIFGLLGSASLVGIAYNHGERAFPLVSAVVIVFTLLWYLAKVVHARPMVNTAVTLFGFGYVGILGGFAGLLLAYPHGVGMVAGLVICVVGYDVMGYLVGSRVGRRALAPDVSPGKTVEGLVAGMLASVVLGVVVSQILGVHPWDSVRDGLLLGLVVAVFAPIGDLCESMLKRDLGVKDFGSLLPGHGGVLDRFDAILFCLPAVYYLVVALGIT